MVQTRRQAGADTTSMSLAEAMQIGKQRRATIDPLRTKLLLVALLRSHSVTLMSLFLLLASGKAMSLRTTALSTLCDTPSHQFAFLHFRRLKTHAFVSLQFLLLLRLRSLLLTPVALLR